VRDDDHLSLTSEVIAAAMPSIVRLHVSGSVVSIRDRELERVCLLGDPWRSSFSITAE